MPRAPFQVLVIPFRRTDPIEYAALRREDTKVWQGVAGGGEASETPEQAATREAREELGLTQKIPIYRLQTTGSIPARFFSDRDSWPDGTYVVPEYSFAADLTGSEIKISHEHVDIRWLAFQTAHDMLQFASNRTALGELRERLINTDLPLPIE